MHLELQSSIESEGANVTGSNESCEGLVSIRDFVRWGATRFNEAGLFFGHGSDNALDESLHLVFQVLQLPWDLPDSYLDSRLTHRERDKLANLIAVSYTHLRAHET